MLPYNAPANGASEAAVKGIKLLLDKHVAGYADWQKSFVSCESCWTGTSTRAPSLVLFPRFWAILQPMGTNHLESLSLLPEKGSGSEWLAEIRHRKVTLHVQVRQASEGIEKARALEVDLRRKNENPRVTNKKIKAEGPMCMRDHRRTLYLNFHGTPWPCSCANITISKEIRWRGWCGLCWTWWTSPCLRGIFSSTPCHW